MDIKPGQQAEIMVDETTGTKFRACGTCKRFNVQLLDTRRTCPGCRQKRNESSRKAREKSRAKIREAGLAAGDPGQRSSSPGLSNSTPTHPNPPPPKRKAEETIRDLEGEGRRKKAAKTMKLSLDVTVQKQPANKQVSRHPEYQSASSLYEAAKKASSASGQCNFLGCHSIVRCEGINHRKRAKFVMKDLRKVVKLSFKYDVPYSDVDTKIKCLLKYTCDCSKSITASASSKSSTKKKNENTGNVDRPCGGFVVITVQDDNSHFLGIPGQQVVVQIQH